MIRRVQQPAGQATGHKAQQAVSHKAHPVTGRKAPRVAGRRTNRAAAATAATVLALLLQGCGMLGIGGGSSSSSSSPTEPSPAAAPPTDAARASGKAPLLVSARTGREAAIAIEQAMDASDIVKLGGVLIVAGSTVPQSWRNPKSGREFTVTPMRNFAGDQGACREFSVDVNANGQIDRMSGAACQSADQRWRVLR